MRWYRAKLALLRFLIPVAMFNMSPVIAEEFEDGPIYNQADDVMLVVTASVNDDLIIQGLGSYSVIARTPENLANTAIERVQNLSVMRDALGRLGLADHSVLFSPSQGYNADDNANSYGLTVSARYPNSGWALLQLDSLDSAERLITQFETDDRVRLVEMNVNFYDAEPT